MSWWMVILDQVLTFAGFGVGYLLARGRRVAPPYVPAIANTQPPTIADLNADLMIRVAQVD